MKQKREDVTKLFMDKVKVFLVVSVFAGIFTGCASHQDNGYYERANKASEKALEKLDRE